MSALSTSVHVMTSSSDRRPTHLTIDDQPVEIRRSSRRKRTIQARFEDGVVVVLAPASMSAREERRAVEDLVRRVTRKSRSARNDDALMERARQLSRTYVPGAPVPSSVRWVSNMTSRWASCSPADGSIRLSDAIVGMPAYVVDAVLLHEVAHLVERGHGVAFQTIVRADPKHDVAQAYLAGASFGARRTADALPQHGLDDDNSERAATDAHATSSPGDDAPSVVR